MLVDSKYLCQENQYDDARKKSLSAPRIYFGAFYLLLLYCTRKRNNTHLERVMTLFHMAVIGFIVCTLSLTLGLAARALNTAEKRTLHHS